MSTHKPTWFQVYLWLWISYAIIAAGFCIRMIFNHNNKWYEMSHRNGILWGLVIYLFFRALFYMLYLNDDEKALGDFIYFCLIDVPTMIFFMVYTQLVLYWAQMTGSHKLEEQRWKHGYYALLGLLSVILIVDITYRVKDANDGSEDNTMRYVYGLTIGVLSLGLSASFLYYGWSFYLYLDTLPEGDVRRRRLPRILAAMVLFSCGFLVYGCFIIFGYAADLDYLPGTDTGLSHSQESALVFRSMDVLLAGLIMYIIKKPTGKSADWRTRTFPEPLLEALSPGNAEPLTTAAARQGIMSMSMGEELESPLPEPQSQSASPGRKDRRAQAAAHLAQEAREDRFMGMCQPMTLNSNTAQGFSGSENDDFPYRDRVLKHYRSNYASFTSATGSGSATASDYEPPSLTGSNSSNDANENGVTTI